MSFFSAAYARLRCTPPRLAGYMIDGGLGEYGKIWECMGVYGSVWECMGGEYLPPRRMRTPPLNLRRDARAVLCVAADLSFAALAKEDAAECCVAATHSVLLTGAERLPAEFPIPTHTLPYFPILSHIHRAADRCAPYDMVLYAALWVIHRTTL